jgi:CRISPR-associated endonuclease Cas1
MTAPLTPRRVERHRDWSLPRTPPRKQGEIVVVDGFGVTVKVARSRLVIADGAGRNRRERRYGRATSKLARLVVLGGSGTLSLDAIRWLADVGASLVCIDRDHTVMVTSAATKAEAKLRRAQALAPYTAVGLAITRELLRAKLEGQRQLLDRLEAEPHPQQVLERCLAAIDGASSIEDVVAAEAEAAGAYWGAWAEVEVRFRPGDRRRVPEEWLRVGQRTSPIGGGPRMAVTPAGAILNYLYSLLEAEARLACLILGLDPALAIVHADTRGRDSLLLDLMEAVRPSVDGYLLALLRDRVFRAGDLYETQRGNVRLLAPLTHELAETLPKWRRLVAPVAEHVVSQLVKGEPRLKRLPTPLTEANRRADRARRNGRADAAASTAKPLRPEPRCKRCGGGLPNRERTYCDDCLPHYQRERYEAFVAAGRANRERQQEAGVDPAHGGEAARRRGATMARRHRERREWAAANDGAAFDRRLFELEILPLIRELPLADLIRATGLTHGYLSHVRQGEKVPHPRHWSALRTAVSRKRSASSSEHLPADGRKGKRTATPTDE